MASRQRVCIAEVGIFEKRPPGGNAYKEGDCEVTKVYADKRSTPN